MNILFLTDILPVGGSRTFLLNVSAALAEQGHLLYLIGFTDQQENNFPIDHFFYVDFLITKRLRPVNFLNRFLLLHRALNSIQQVNKIDAIVVDLPHPAAVLYFLRPFFSKFLKNTKIIYQFHGLDTLEVLSQKAMIHEDLSKNVLLSIKKKLRLTLECLVLNRLPSKIIVFSEYSRKLLREVRITTPIMWIKPGKDLELLRISKGLSKKKARAELGLAAESTIALIVSRLEPRKGVVSFFQDLPDKYKDLKFLVLSDFSDGYSYDFFFTLAKKKLGAQVLCISCPSRADLALAYSASDVTIVPSLDFETFGLVSLESMSLGTPVVGYRIGANTEVIEKNLLTQPGKILKLLEKATEVAQLSEQSRRNLVHAMHQRVKDYEWDLYAHTLISLL